MPIFLAAFLGGLATAAASMVGRILIALAIGYVTYTGIDVALNSIKGDVIANISALNSVIIQVLGLLRIDQSINILFSAYAARLVIRGLTNGAITKAVIK